MDLPSLIHEIARYAIFDLSVPAEVRERARDGLLTPEDCMFIAEQLALNGRDLSAPEIKQAKQLGQQSAEHLSRNKKEKLLEDLLHAMRTASEEEAWQAYLTMSRNMPLLTNEKEIEEES